MRHLSLLAVILLTGACERQFVQACPPLVTPNDPIPLVAPPFQQIRRTHVRLRFETTDFVDIPVSVDVAGERCQRSLTPETDRQPRTFSHPGDGVEVELPDLPGDYVLHTQRLDDLPPGEEVPWAVYAGRTEADVWSGTTRTVPVAGDGATVLFAGSFAPPVQADVLSLVPGADLVLLAGDLRRDGTPGSTWSRLAHDIAIAQPGALVHTAIGDLEDAEPTSRDEVYLRWYGEQGRAGGTDRYYAIDVAGVRFIVLDGQDGRLDVEGSAQRRWLDEELDDVSSESGLTEAVVVMHRGPHGLSTEVPYAELRESLLPRLRDAGVRLLLSGHNHGYQRFDDGGLVVIDDGGGGAALSDLDHRLERDADGAALRQVADASHGATRLDIGADGALTLTRLAVDGTEVDSVTLAPPGTDG